MPDPAAPHYRVAPSSSLTYMCVCLPVCLGLHVRCPCASREAAVCGFVHACVSMYLCVCVLCVYLCVYVYVCMCLCVYVRVSLCALSLLVCEKILV